MALHRLLARNVILIAAGVIGVLCWPMMCGAQMVGPTPQPQGIPVTPEQAEQVEAGDLGHSWPGNECLAAATGLPLTVSGTP